MAEPIAPGSAAVEGTVLSSAEMAGGVCVKLTCNGRAFDLKADGARDACNV